MCEYIDGLNMVADRIRVAGDSATAKFLEETAGYMASLDAEKPVMSAEELRGVVEDALHSYGHSRVNWNLEGYARSVVHVLIDRNKLFVRRKGSLLDDGPALCRPTVKEGYELADLVYKKMLPKVSAAVLKAVMANARETEAFVLLG